MSHPTSSRPPLTLHRIRQMAAQGERLTMLTCYDASFARLMDMAGVDLLLVGDSLGMTVQGHQTTIPVSLEDIRYHLRAVSRGNQSAWIIGDMPFGSYQGSQQQACDSALALMKAGAHMVKLEGGGWTVPTVQFLSDRGIPVCAHLGLTPQTVHALGGYRIQGRSEQAAQLLIDQALALQEAGAQMLVVELIPSDLGAAVTRALSIPVIGIGAGARTSGQVLVMHDMLGVTQGKLPRFVRNFMEGSPDIPTALRSYVQAVKSGQFPDEAVHGYSAQ